jgi:hypothetical protein
VQVNAGVDNLGARSIGDGSAENTERV